MAAEAAYRQCDLEVVTFIPAGAPWQKASADVSDATHRWEMTKLAIEGVDYFEADDREVRRDGWTYTVDTLEMFVEFRASGPSRRRGDLGNLEQQPFDRSPELVRFLETRPGQRHGADRQRPLVKLGEERPYHPEE